jgi:hypothetical protein
LLNYSIELASPHAPFGNVLSTHLTVAGRVRPAYRFKGSRQLWFFDFKDPDDKDSARPATAIWDCPDDLSGEQFSQFLCLEILPYGEDEWVRDCDPGDVTRPAGLILGEKEGTGILERLGWFDFEWDNQLWLQLYQDGSRDHNERRVQWQENVFKDRPKSVFTIA